MDSNNLNSKTKNYDLTFIGSGIATSFTIISLLQKLHQKSVSIAIIEKSEEFHTGIAYGPRSGNSALLITSLADFLPEGSYRNDFIEWLTENKNFLLNELSKHDGVKTQKWLKTHELEINNNQWEDIYIPRRFFGLYINEKVKKAIKKNKNAKIDLINDEATAILPNTNGFEVTLTNNTLLNSRRVVLSIGIPPIKKLWDNIEFYNLSKYACLIENPYNPSLSKNLEEIGKFVAKLKTKGNILIVGSNASAMEMIYKLHDEPEISARLDKFFVVSPQGELPNSAQTDFTKSINFEPKHLLALQNKLNLTAHAIYNAANLDLDYAESLGYGTAITEIPISKGFTGLLKQLSTEELEKFACHYGNEIGKRQRRAGQHYTDVVANLELKNKILNFKGYVRKLQLNENNKEVNFIFESRKDGNTYTFNQPVHIVLGCIGGKLLTQKPVTPLIDQLINDKICVVNKSKRGFSVDKNLQAYKGLFIAGPLLAGNVVEENALWHLEHCGRLIKTGEVLAKKILNGL